jgi:LAO/AO transport system kinase
VRMMRHATDPMVFVRSVASRGHLGGLSLGVKGIIHVLGLAGADVVFVETVGVGQSEVEVARVADLVAIVLAPGQGDSVQLLKAGLMEIGDLFVVNKADRPDAERLYSQLLATLRLQYPYEAEGHDETDGAEPLVHLTEAARHADGSQQALLASAIDGRGIAEIADWIEAAASRERDRLLARREAALTSDFREAVLEAARRRLGVLLEKDGLAREVVERLVRGEATVEGLAHELVARASEDR